jgi:cell filamentation protein
VNREDPYLYPGTSVLRNLLGIRDADRLDAAERKLVINRTQEGPPSGNLDAGHLRAIHRHLFQDIFDWAGEFRTVEIAKEGSQFQFARFIDVGLADVHRRIVERRFLTELSPDRFCEEAGPIIGDLNYVHPFREGNGRTQVEFLRQLAFRAGHNFTPAKIDQSGWIEASRASHLGNYKPFSEQISLCLEPGRA